MKLIAVVIVNISQPAVGCYWGVGAGILSLCPVHVFDLLEIVYFCNCFYVRENRPNNLHYM